MRWLELVIALGVILAGAELFTNGVEWVGEGYGLSEGAVGSVLAAVGTALPETILPLVAVLSGHTGGDEIGIGAILGAPFMLSTLALGVTGVVVFLARGRRSTGTTLEIDRHVVRADLVSFGAAYLIVVGSAFLPVEPTWPKLLAAVVLFVLYGWYVKGHLDAESSVEASDLNPLRFHRLDRARAHLLDDPPRLRVVVLQLAVGLFAIIGGAVAFVQGVDDIARSAGLDQVLLALIVAPIATELPEAANAVLWIRQGKDTLAIGNITGAMVFQASIATIVALVFAPAAWSFQPGTRIAFASAAIAFVSIGVIFLPLLRGGSLKARALLLGVGFYVAYLALVAVAELTG
jgi:cation:H+ antiporter